MTDELRTLDCTSRRAVLRGLAAVGVSTIAAGVLVACGSGDGTATSGTTASDAGDATGGGTATGGETGAAGGTEASLPLSEVPVGEAVVVAALGSRYVVAQPSAGQVVAFSAACTHAGTEVVPDGGLELRCPNHGSRFDAGDGAAVLNGPASTPLPAIDARVEGDLVVLSA